MPKSLISKKKLFRDFSHLNQRYVKKNHLKYLRPRTIAERIVYQLVREGYLYKHFDKMTPSNTREDHIFRDETKYNYRVRYALTQKARLLVQAFYRELEM